MLTPETFAPDLSSSKRPENIIFERLMMVKQLTIGWQTNQNKVSHAMQDPSLGKALTAMTGAMVTAHATAKVTKSDS